MNFLTWFFGGERYRMNFASLGMIAVAVAGLSETALAPLLAVPVIAIGAFRYRRWCAAHPELVKPRED